MKFSKTKTDDSNDKNEANNNWEDGTEALPYEVLEKRFVSIGSLKSNLILSRLRNWFFNEIALFLRITKLDHTKNPNGHALKKWR